MVMMSVFLQMCMCIGNVNINTVTNNKYNPTHGNRKFQIINDYCQTLQRFNSPSGRIRSLFLLIMTVSFSWNAASS